MTLYWPSMETDSDATVRDEIPLVLYEDGDCLVISKPYGWLTHEDGKTDAPTVVEWFLGRAPEARGVGEAGYAPNGRELERSGVVHRLDRETSGVLVLAKTAAAHAHLKAQFHDRLARKEYRALVYGHVHDRYGTVDRSIGRSPRDPRQRSAQPGATGTLRPAVTDYERIGAGEYQGEPFSYLKLTPRTGRTHQLRVHLKSLDRPIVRDPLYAAHLVTRSNHLGLDRMALHAHVLELTLQNGEPHRFIAPVPSELEAGAERLAED